MVARCLSKNVLTSQLISIDVWCRAYDQDFGEGRMH